MKNNKLNIKIVVIEDDQFFRKSVHRYLKHICDHKNNPDVQFQIKVYGEAENAILDLEEDLDIMILDYNFGTSGGEQLTGEDVLTVVNSKCHNCEVIMMSAHREPSLVARLMRKGMHSFIDKTFPSIHQFGTIVQRSIQRAKHA